MTGCATVQPSGCIAITPYDQVFFDRVDSELDSVPEGGAIDEVIADWISMRDQARACDK